MATAYFLGAGASKADGFPLTSELPALIAARLRRRKASDPLRRFYRGVYGFEGTTARGTARGSAPLLPDVTEVLTLMELALESETTFGPLGRHDLNGEAIEAARLAMVSTIAAVVQAVGKGQIRHNAYRLARALHPGDAIITTNWDHALDRALEFREGHDKPHPSLRGSDVDYGCAHATLVAYSGEPLGGALTKKYKLLKLHGGTNWFECTRCGNLYINVEYSRSLAPTPRRSDYNSCDCRALLRNLIVTPSFIKHYRSPHLAAVWTEALRSLWQAQEWVFIGYSLPPDDYHIRALLLRALSAYRDHHGRSIPKITVVSRGKSTTDPEFVALLNRYRTLLGPKVQGMCGGFEELTKTLVPAAAARA